jgi:hypothetical protein
MTRGLLVVLAYAGVIGGCTAQKPAARPAAAAPAPAVTTPARAVPSLEEAQRRQGDRTAAALSKRVGVTLERVEGAAPGWWQARAGAGRGQAPTLEGAYQAAARQAKGSARAGYARTATGEYVVWVLAESAPVVTAAAPAVAAPAPAETRAEGDAPAWFTTSAREVDGRVQVGAAADAATVRDAPRMATEAARAALGQVLGREVTDLRLESTFVKKVGEQYRAYVLVSAPGALR